MVISSFLIHPEYTTGKHLHLQNTNLIKYIAWPKMYSENLNNPSSAPYFMCSWPTEFCDIDILFFKANWNAPSSVRPAPLKGLKINSTRKNVGKPSIWHYLNLRHLSFLIVGSLETNSVILKC